jgi:hypothetical protein
MNTFNTTLVMIVALAVGSAVAYFPDYSAVSARPRPTQPIALPAVGQVPRPASKLSADAAYATLQCRRTRFDSRQAAMSANEREYLVLMFDVIDTAVLARVEATAAIRNGSSAAEHVDALNQLTKFTCSFDAPPTLRPYHRLITDALSRQAAFYGDWQREGKAFVFAANETMPENDDLQIASRAVKRAYDELMSRYRDEGRQNRDSFADYHAALDVL